MNKILSSICTQSTKGKEEQQKEIRREVGKEGEVVYHKRYSNLTRSLNKELIVPLLDKVKKSIVLRCNIVSKGQLLLLNEPNGGLEVGIVSGG